MKYTLLSGGVFLIAVMALAQENRITAIAAPVLAAGPGSVLLQVRASHSSGPANLQVVAAAVEGSGFSTTYPALYDDGTHGDRKSGDGIYSLAASPMGLPGERTVTYYVVDTTGAEVITTPASFTLR